MKRKVLLAAAVVFSTMLACELPEEGGGGGIGISDFSSGFVFVRADDKNVYAADSSTGFSEVARLTQNGDNRHPSLSPNGAQVVFVHGSGAGSSLMLAALSGGAPRTVLAADAEAQRFAHPTFSPDGQRIAFTFERGGRQVLGVVNADGSGFTEVSQGSVAHGSPSWYPDGLHVLVASGAPGMGFTGLERVNVETGAAQNVLNGLGTEAVRIRNRVVLSKDGTRAAFDGELSSGVSRIFAVTLATRAVTRLTDYPADPTANDSFPTWSGASEVAFSSDTGGNDQVYTVSSNAVRGAGTLRLPSAIEPWFGP